MFFTHMQLFTQIKYKVKAQNGLIVRLDPRASSERVGKLNYNDTIIINEISKIDTILDEGYKLAGHWVKVNNGYVFDGFLREVNSGGKKKKEKGLLGKIKSVSDLTKVYKSGELVTSKTNLGDKYVFDVNGNCIEDYDSYGKEDKYILDYQYEYDQNNNLIRKKNYTGVKLYSVESYIYNEKGQKIEKNNITEGNPYYKWMYTYDKNGNLIEEEDYYYNKMRSKRWVSAYDDKNRKIALDFYGYNEKHKYRINYSYDNFDRLIKKTRKIIATNKVFLNEEFIYKDSLDYKIEIHKNYTNKGILKGKTTKIFKEGKLFKQELIEKKHKKSDLDAFFTGYAENDNKTVLLYDNNEELIEKKFFSFEKGKASLTAEYRYKPNYRSKRTVVSQNRNEFEEYFYDYKGNLIKEITYYYYKTGEKKRKYATTNYFYIFDKRNNWISKKIFYKGVLSKEIGRVIVYYDN